MNCEILQVTGTDEIIFLSMKKSIPSVLDLAGAWEFRSCKSSSWLPAAVPGCVHTDLRNNGLIPDPFYGANELGLSWIENTDFEYRKKFDVTPDLLGHRFIELVADGLDTLAVISINGSPVAETENMFIGYRFNIKTLLRPGPNTVRIRFNNPFVYIKTRPGYPWFDQPNDPIGGSAGIRKMQCSFGWDWGPRLPTCGIYRSIRIEARSTSRITHVAVLQRHANGTVALHCIPEAAHSRKGISWRFTLSFKGKILESSASPEIRVSRPQLWWPNGFGPQPLYELTVDLLDHGVVLDSWHRRIGLRTIELDRHKDAWGESFRFLVNGVPVYAKGASWVPPHALPSMVGDETCRDLVRSAAEANFTMLRVWGGGLYERDEFYDLCDSYGIMVWHDFMFACSLYPHDSQFARSAAAEARYQTRRLGHHASMALWCGNNELEQHYREILSDSRKKKAYERIFYHILPETVKTHCPQIPYWPASPHNPAGYDKGPDSETGGDCHYWDVWHRKLPAEAARRHHFRFWSEFGMQSYCNVDTALTFASKGALNVFGPAMENHQKHPAGNATIMEYIARGYRYPKDFAALSYLSQVNQAHCIRLMVEHQRASMPRTMGSLYWQLNDCWPAFSWSSIDFGGRWKGLHFAARRFFNPALATFRLIGGETVGKINRRLNTVTGVELITAFDGIKSRRARLSWDLYTIHGGKPVLHGVKPAILRPCEAILQTSIDLTREFSRFGKENLAMRIALTHESRVLSENTVLFTAPRFMDLPKEDLRPRVRSIGDNRFSLGFTGRTFQHQVSFHLPGVSYRASNNFFDLFPGVPLEVIVTIEGKNQVNRTWVQKRLQVVSVADTY
jgi:beta-mannosidase